MPEVSIVIPSRNSSKTIVRLLKSVFNQNFPKRKYEVIVVDSSTDDTLEKISKFNVKIIKVPTPPVRNSNILRNMGAKASRGEYLFFVDSDSEVSRNWISEILSVFKNQNVVCVGGNIISKGNIFDDYVTDAIISPMRVSKKILITDKGNFHNRFWPIGGNVAFKKSIFRKFNGFPPKTTSYEEVELLWKMCKKNYKLALTPKTLVIHHYNRGFLKMMRTYFRYGTGCGNFAIKNFSSRFSKFRLSIYFLILFFYFTLLVPNFKILISLYMIFLTFYLLKTRDISKSLLYPFLDFSFIGVSFMVGMTISLIKRFFSSR
ncbi:MAG: glycosyltransferase [Candidatus Aenigmarchaeota archaeon]|nr:glycosyltransferase [Candidatus Aenigmarchaeota archaeon]